MRTLVVRDDRLGDLVLTLPAIDALARAGDEVTLVASEANAELVAHPHAASPGSGPLAEAARAGLPRQTNDQSHSSTPLRHAYIRDASSVNANRLITRAVQAGIWL